MLRITATVSCATRRLALAAAPATAPLSRSLHTGLTQVSGAAPRAASLSAGLSSSSTAAATACCPRALVHATRAYARKPSAHDSNAEEESNTFFDVQDVDADRLTHFYWDSNDEADTPYDASLWDSMLGEGEQDEFSGESLMYVDERDQVLLEEEYLR